eukprot:TRINITY_DN907_c0_g1_i2.p1 TRINITY_DN907_c0_g1~~TRINITY_DN907_c0_g1_i2.p1  ORF type:complete len:245 (-),score=60.15 TRINITY_DN907_c0_g1_i2:262-996(-)
MYVSYGAPGGAPAPNGFYPGAPGVAPGYGSQPMPGAMSAGMYQQPQYPGAPPQQPQYGAPAGGLSNYGAPAGMNMYGQPKDPYAMYPGASASAGMPGAQTMDMGFQFTPGPPPPQQAAMQQPQQMPQQQMPQQQPHMQQQQQHQQQQQPHMQQQQQPPQSPQQRRDPYGGGQPAPGAVSHSAPGHAMGAPPPGGAPGAPQEPDPDDDPNRLPTFVKVRGLPAEHDPRIARRPKPKKRAPVICCA